MTEHKYRAVYNHKCREKIRILISNIIKNCKRNNYINKIARTENNGNLFLLFLLPNNHISVIINNKTYIITATGKIQTKKE